MSSTSFQTYRPDIEKYVVEIFPKMSSRSLQRSIEIFPNIIIQIFRKMSSRCFSSFFSHFYFPASGQAVVTGVFPSSPRFLPSICIAHRVQHSPCSSIFHRVLLTHALALSASQFMHKKKSQRIYTSMHSAGLELAKLTYTRLEDNLIRHRGDRLLLKTRRSAFALYCTVCRVKSALKLVQGTVFHPINTNLYCLIRCKVWMQPKVPVLSQSYSSLWMKPEVLPVSIQEQKRGIISTAVHTTDRSRSTVDHPDPIPVGMVCCAGSVQYRSNVGRMC